jgi:hypothetical protein
LLLLKANRKSNNNFKTFPRIDPRNLTVIFAEDPVFSP